LLQTFFVRVHFFNTLAVLEHYTDPDRLVGTEQASESASKRTPDSGMDILSTACKKIYQHFPITPCSLQKGLMPSHRKTRGADRHT
jgi:hypothetical protein